MEIIDKLKEITEPAVGPVMDMVTDLVLEGVAGVVVPGVGNLILSYKQQRTEKNLEMFISQIVARQNEFNERLNQLDTEKLEKITSHYFGIVTDYVLNIRQQEKIRFIVNGYINIAGQDELNDDAVIMYYDTLDELTILDIRVLKLYCSKPIYGEDTFNQVKKDYNLDRSQLNYIRGKLERLGLIENQRDVNYGSLYDKVIAIGTILEKGREVSKPLRIGQLKKSKENVITKYGEEFLDFFSKE